MKKLHRPRHTTGITCILLIYMLLQGCSITNRIYTDNDVVTSSKRFELRYAFKDFDRRSPLFYFTQALIKEINPENEVTYTAYDVLSLSASSFRLDERAVFIIDNEVYPMSLERMELENARDISETTSNILTSDSTTISVITGYSEDNRKITRLSYRIPAATMEKIRSSDNLILRYYSGPSMITVKPRNKSVKKLKQLIDMT